MNLAMCIQILVCIFIIFIVVANPPISGNGLDGLMGGSSDKKSKSNRLKKQDKIFLMIIFIFFSLSLTFSIISQNVDNVKPLKIEKLIAEDNKNV